MNTENDIRENSAPVRAPLTIHIPALDGIRGLAILLVLLFHLLWSNTNTGSRLFDFVGALRSAGWVGVDLFFVLSGFLITGILYDSLNGEGYFKKFYARRMLRIFPLYYGFLFLLLALTYPLNLSWHGMQWMLIAYLQNTGLVIPLSGYRPSAYINLNHFWSLAVEEQFYLVWPFLVFWIRDLQKLILTTLGLSLLALMLRILLLSQGVDRQFISCFTACRADSLLLGGCLALLLHSRWRERVISLAKPVFAIAISVLILVAVRNHGLTWNDGVFLATGGFTLLAVTGGALIAETFSEKSWTRPVFENVSLRFLGKYSYGIYVFHYSLDASLTGLLRETLLRFSHSKLVSVAGAAVAVAGITIIVAMISFRFYERPFLKLKKYFDYDVRKSKPARVTVS